jgi:MFS family permease
MITRARALHPVRVAVPPHTRVWLASFLCFAAFYGIAAPVGKVLEDLKAQPISLSLVAATFGVTALTVRPAVGVLADRYRLRWILGAGAGFTAVGVGGLVVAQDVAQVVLLRSAQAVGYVAMTTAGTALIAGFGPSSTRAARLARYGLAANTAMALSPAVAAALAMQANWTLVILGLAGGVAAGGLVGQVDAPGGDDRLSRAMEPWHRATSSTVALRAIGGRPWLIATLLGLAFGFFLQFAPVRAAELGGPQGAGIVLGAYGVAIIATRIAAGAWLDRTRLGPIAVVGGGCLMAGLGTIAVDSFPLAVVGALALGLGGGIVQPAVLAECVKRAPGRSGLAVAFAYFGFDLGLALSGLILGPVASAAGMRGAFAVAGLLMVGMILLGLGGEKTRASQPGSTAVLPEES